MGPLATLGMQAAGQATGAAMGILAGSINDGRQYKQQKRLQELQIQGQQRMMDYSMQKQLQMWKDTSYPAQVEMMNKAGINPALMYGMGGGGGTTAGSPSGNVTGATATQNPGELAQMMGMGMQLQLLQAQKKVLETQADKNTAEANATKGVDTALKNQSIAESQQRVENLMQGLDNMKQDYEVKRLEIAMKNMENFEKQATQSDRLSYIKTEARTAIENLKSVAAEANIDTATVADKIKIIQQQAINSVLQNINIQATTRKTDQEISQIANNIMINWDYLSNDNQRLQIQKDLKDWNTDPNREAINQALNVIPKIMDMMPKDHRNQKR